MSGNIVNVRNLEQQKFYGLGDDVFSRQTLKTKAPSKKSVTILKQSRVATYDETASYQNTHFLFNNFTIIMKSLYVNLQCIVLLSLNSCSEQC